MARKIVITSGKGGVGKTTVCANLGLHLSKLNKRVVLIDVDIGLNNLDVITGVENKIVFDIVDVIEKRCRVKQALIQDVFQQNLYIMPSAHSYNKANVTAENIKSVVEILDPFFDFVLIDCPAGVDEPFHRAVYGANEAILVVTPHISSIRDADKVATLLTSYNLNGVHLIVNKARGDLIMDKEMISVEEISSALCIDTLGVVPEDDEISVGNSFWHNNLSEKAVSNRAFSYIAENLCFGTNKCFDCTKKYKGILGYFKRGIKRIVKWKNLLMF